MTDICPGCKNEVDLDVCHCGIELKDHSGYEGHSFVPMGCDCGREKPSPEPERGAKEE